MARVLIVGGTDESRLLLRGLLRLHQHEVLGECKDLAAVARLGPAEGPLVVVFDADLENPEWSEGVRALIAGRPGLRGVLVTPDRSARIEAKAKAAGITTLVRRPFGIQELMEAIVRESDGAPGPSGR